MIPNKHYSKHNVSFRLTISFPTKADALQYLLGKIIWPLQTFTTAGHTWQLVIGSCMKCQKQKCLVPNSGHVPVSFESVTLSIVQKIDNGRGVSRRGRWSGDAKIYNRNSDYKVSNQIQIMQFTGLICLLLVSNDTLYIVTSEHVRNHSKWCPNMIFL